MAAKTARDLGHGTGAALNVATNRVITFVQPSDLVTPSPQDLKPGCQIVLRPWQDPIPDYVYTVAGGSGAAYLLDQVPAVGGNYYSDEQSTWGVPVYHMSLKTSSRTRGATNSGGVYAVGPQAAPYRGFIVPDATHFIYWAPLDDAGNPDYYVYVDTLEPERGIHPYTRDKAIGSFKTAPLPAGINVDGRMIADLATRVRELEGALRAGRPSGSKSQDYRI